MGSVGLPELIIIFTIALIVFGPRKLPDLGRSLGKSIAEFKKASNELRSTLDEEIRAEERRTAQQPQVPQTFDAPLGQSQLAGSAELPDGSIPRRNDSA